MIGHYFYCRVTGDRCPFNWDFLAESKAYETYFFTHCPCQRYRGTGFCDHLYHPEKKHHG